MQNDRAKFKSEFKNRLYRWVLHLIAFIDTLPKDSTCGVLGKQLLRSGTSVLANYVEAQSASSRRDFINFFTHSLKSANESKIWLDLLRDTQKGPAAQISALSGELVQIANMLASSIITLKVKR